MTAAECRRHADSGSRLAGPPPTPVAGAVRRFLLVLLLCSAGCWRVAGADQSLNENDSPAAGVRLEPVLSARLVTEYDDNVYLQNLGPLAKHGSWINAVMPVAGVVLRPADGTDRFRLKLAYEADYRFFHSEPTESYLQHMGVLEFEGSRDPWQLQTRATVQYTDGSTDSVVWNPPGGIPALGGYEVRNRRRHFLYQQRLAVRYELGRFFLRGVYEGRVWDFMIDPKPVPFYQNFVDRDDLNAGPEVGWKPGEACAWSLGYRIGHQNQAANPYVPFANAANTYHRVLVGLDTRAWGWLKLSGEAGPSIHEFEPGVALPGQAEVATLLYCRATASLAIGTNTTVSLGTREGLLPSSAGRAAYENIAYTGGIEHRFSRVLSAGVSLTVEEYHFLAPVARWDRVFTPAAKVRCRLDSHLALELRYSFASADSLVPNLDARAYDRHRFGIDFIARY
ncbi:MAG: hypothetical protein H7A46_09250 [Verrucomicrobiales bacterium]|nr:hypothetical protein [Verrucomicrobiales bacterium]